MSGWRVDPDRVVGVLAGVDECGSALAAVTAEADALSMAGSGLIADGRHALAQAWEAFLEERRSVPGKLAYSVSSAASAVSSATLDVVAGDVEMADSGAAAEDLALQRWGIDTFSAYVDGGYW